MISKKSKSSKGLLPLPKTKKLPAKKTKVSTKMDISKMRWKPALIKKEGLTFVIYVKPLTPPEQREWELDIPTKGLQLYWAKSIDVDYGNITVYQNDEPLLESQFTLYEAK